MENLKNTRRLILKQIKTYPSLQLQDLFKFLFQSAFGCEHLISLKEKAVQYISEEYNRMLPQKATVEVLDGNYSRVNLGILAKGLSPKTLGEIFYLSAKKEEDGLTRLKAKLELLKQMIINGELAFNIKEFDELFCKWESAGFCAIHHSENFRKNYFPSYRVVANEYVPFLPLLTKIDIALKQKSSIIVAIDGGSASGKSTLASLLQTIYDCNLFHTDDYFLQPHQRTNERLKEPGGNMDRERLLQEILLPLSTNKEIAYKKFDCQTQSLSNPITPPNKKLCIIEGCYSMHPDLISYYDLCVFLDISPTLQKKRILKRNTQNFAKLFFEEWIPLENIYFEAFKIKEKANLIIKSKDFK